MNDRELIDIQSEFILISNYLLESTEDTFTANLSSFKEFCVSTKVIFDILEPISKITFNGVEYFCNKSNPVLRLTQYEKPKNHKELLKVSYDVLWDDKLKASALYNYAVWVFNPDTKNIDELLSIGNNEISKQLIDYINLEITKLINNQRKEPVPNQVNFNIQNAHDSIIGTQTNATINNGITFDEAIKSIDSMNIDSADKQQLIELTNYVKLLSANNAPMSKGLLSKFSDVISKHAWAVTLIGNALIKHFIS